MTYTKFQPLILIDRTFKLYQQKKLIKHIAVYPRAANCLIL